MDFDGRFEYSKTISAEVENDAISIFPYPTDGVLSVQGEDLEDATFTVTDMRGSIVLSGGLSDGQLDISGLPAGMYMVAITSNGQVVVERIIKE